MVARSVRIDPVAVEQGIQPRARASATNSGFNDVIMGLSAMGPALGETFHQAGYSNAAAVIHSAFSALPGAFGSGGGGSLAGDVLGGLPGIYGRASHTTMPGEAPSYASGGGIPGMDGLDQGQLIDQMNTNNLQLLELQAIMQNNMQQWTTKSNVLKAVHDAKMAMIQHFAPR